jgi:hypothetical protein
MTTRCSSVRHVVIIDSFYSCAGHKSRCQQYGSNVLLLATLVSRRQKVMLSDDDNGCRKIRPTVLLRTTLVRLAKGVTGTGTGKYSYEYLPVPVPVSGWCRCVTRQYEPVG